MNITKYESGEFMRRILSVILVITLVFTMCIFNGVEVFAARTYKVQSEDKAISFAVSSSLPITKTEVDGFGGRGVGDKSVYAERTVATAGSSLKNSYINCTNLSDIDSTKDLIIETSFIPYLNVKNVAFGTDKNASIGISSITVDKFSTTHWNKLKIVISGNTANVYINGEKYNSYTYSGLTNGVFRLIFTSSDTSYTSPIGVYVDYLYIYQENVGLENCVEAMPFNSESGEGYTTDFDSGIIKFTNDILVGELKTKLGVADSVALRVYSNDKYTTQLSDSDKVSDENVIVLQTESNIFQYLTVETDDGIELIYSHNGNTTSNIAGSTAKNILEGFAGKDTSDSVISYSRESKNAYLRPSAENDFIDVSKVLIADMQFFVGDTIASFTLGSASNGKIAKNLGGIDSSNFNIGRWNNLRAVIDWSNDKASLYFNNVKISSNTTITYDNTSNGGLRFIFSGTSPVELCFDNIRFYETSKNFEVVDKGFSYPVTASTSQYSYDSALNEINFGSYNTLGDIKNKLNITNGEVRAYNADFTTRYTDSQVVGKNSIIVVELETGEIQYINVGSNDPVDRPTQLYYNDGSSKGYGTSAQFVTGAKGRTADDSSIKVAVSATTGVIWYGTPANTLSISNTAKDLVYEYSFVPPEGMKYLKLVHSGNEDLGTGSIFASAFKPDTWNKIKLVWNMVTNKGEIFINGKLYDNDIDMIDKVPTELRSVFTLENPPENPYMYMDEIKVYTNDVGLESDEEYSYLIPETGNSYIVDNDTMNYISSNISVGEFKNMFATDKVEIRVYSENYGELLGDSVEISTGDRIVFVTSDDIFTTYTFENMIANKIYLIGEGCYSETQYSANKIESFVLTNGPAVLIISRFNEDGKLLEMETAKIQEAGILKYAYTPADEKGKIKYMLWDSLENSKPLAEMVELEYHQSLSVLIVGNSFSTDSLKYLREIAEADGVEINVGRLIKGGSTFEHHYTTRETTEKVNTLHYNGVNTGYTNLKKVLADYDWDYVAVQNWSSKEPSVQLDSEWSPVGENLIAYIHENEPDAEILINKTWSFEKGYSYVTDSAVQKMSDEHITEKSEMVANNAALLIGVDKIRIVPTGDAFTAARNYTDSNGVRIFDTTYYAEGHSFSSDMNRQTIEVGQGILSPEEEEAGYIRLHRDGFHSSLLARYMLASVWYEALTGNSIIGNTFVPESDALDSGAVVMDEAGSLVVYYKFDSPTQDRIDLIQRIVHTMMLNNVDWNK